MDEQIKFIDLFAGIGGIRLGFEKAGFHCVFSSEWDKYARITYEANFHEVPFGDIRQIQSDAIPPFQVLCAGFPCQPFSIAGVTKKNALGMPHGFLDETQGTLFFEIARIISDCKPQAFMLENVKNLLRHDQGNTFRTIMKVLTEELGYYVNFKVIDAVDYVPQHRERLYIVGFREPLKFEYPPKPDTEKPKLIDILESNVDDKYTLTDHLWEYLQNYAIKHKAKGNGFTFGIADVMGHARTMSARYYKDGAEILIAQPGKNPRRLTPRECSRIMGFHLFKDDFIIPVSDIQAYRQFGNSVAVPVIYDIAIAIMKAMKLDQKSKRTEGALQYALDF